MLITVPPENLERVMAIFVKEEVAAKAIGKLTTQRRLHLSYNGVTVADIDMAFLFNPCNGIKTASIEKPRLINPIP